MIPGITNVAMLMAFVTDLLISRRLGSSQGERKVRTMAGHHVVVGLGTFGLCVVRELLRRGKRVVVVERDEHNSHLAELAPGEASELVGVTMGELGGHTRVVAMQRSEGHVVPRRAERFRAGDLAHVVGPVDDVIALAQRAQVTSSFSSSARALPA